MNKKGLIIYSEDSHDIFLISILKAIKHQDINVFLLLPKSKKIRILEYLKNDTELYSWLESNATFINLKYLNSNAFVKSKLINKWLISVRRIVKILYFIESFNRISFIKKQIKVEIKWNFIVLENYSKLSDIYIKRLINQLRKRLALIGLVIHNTDNNELLKDRIATKFNKYYVLSSELIKSLPTEIAERSSILPFSTPTTETIKNRLNAVSIVKTRFSLVIIGEISSARRDYYSIINFLKFIDSPITITFLGKLTDQSIVDYAMERGIKPIVYGNYVSQLCFDEIMASADFIIYKASLNQKYSYYKASGVLFDSMRYGVPVISLNYVKNEFKFAPSVININNESNVKLNLSAYLEEQDDIYLKMKKNMNYLNEIIIAEILKH